jgi:hypothetical protein
MSNILVAKSTRFERKCVHRLTGERAQFGRKSRSRSDGSRNTWPHLPCRPVPSDVDHQARSGRRGCGRHQLLPPRRKGRALQTSLAEHLFHAEHTATTMTDNPAPNRPRASSSEPPAANPGPGRRGKVGTACRNCRERKTRCDGRQPVCIACENRQMSNTCSYERSQVLSKQ